MQKIHVHNDFDVHLNFTNIKTDYVSRVEFWTRRDDIFCCCKCDGSLKVEDDSNIVCYLNDHNLGTGKLNYNVIFQIPDSNYNDGYKKVCQHYVSDIFLTADNGDTTVAIVKVVGGEEATDLISRLSEFEKVVDGKQDKLQFDNAPTSGSKNVVFSDGIYNAIKNNKPDLSDYAKKSDIPSVEGLASEQWVIDRGYITSIPSDYITETELNSKGYITEHQSLEGYVTETELNSKGYLTEHQSLDDYIKKSGPFPRAIATKFWVNDQKYDTELRVDAKIANKAYAMEQWVNDQGYLTSIPSDYITETELNSKGYITEHQSLEGYVTETELDSKGYLTEHQSLADYATKSDLKGSTRNMATQFWVRNNYVSLKDFIEIVHTPIETFEPAEDTEYTLYSNEYLRIIPRTDAVKLTFNKSSDGATGIMREYHILIDCKTAVPTTEFKGVLWELDNDPVFEKGKLYDIVIRDYETNLFGSWKAYKLMGITILITTSDATDVQLNANTYNLVAGDNSLTNADLKTITDIDGFNGNDKITSIDFGSATIKTADLRSKFSGMLNLTKISNITIEDATSLSSMFASDTQLQKIDTSKWDVSKVTYFVGMFIGCTNLKTLDVSNWNTSSAISFGSMFANCSALTTLDVSQWNISSATGFGDMFIGCTNLKTLDVSNWNTSSARVFMNMFSGCSSLTTLDVSNWDTSSVISFGSMFDGCRGLTALDLSGWNTSNATDFSYMFRGCESLTSLDLSKWNTSKATDFSYMFNGCTNLETIDLSGWDTSSATNFDSMFRGCESLKSLDVSHWDASNATVFSYMFRNCTSLTALNVSNWNTSSAKQFVGMFRNCTSLTALNVSDWDTSNATDFSYMFRGCQYLTSLDLSKWNTSKATDFSYMFNGCTNLETIDLSGWDTSSATNFSNMFENCSDLTSLDLSGWNISTSANITDMFKDCVFLTTIKMVGCSQATIDKINSVKPASATIVTE